MLEPLLARRILVLDGAMGTMIQGYGLGEREYRGERFPDWPRDVKGNSDLLCLTQPQIIREIHGAYLEAGADIIETNSFTSNYPSQADYGMEELVYELNLAAATLAREAADEFERRGSRDAALRGRARWGPPTAPPPCRPTSTIRRRGTSPSTSWWRPTTKRRAASSTAGPTCS